MQKRLTKTELQKLRKRLPEDAKKIIAEETGFAESSVEQILLKPERFNLAVIESAVALAERTSDRIDSLRLRIKNTI